MVFGSPVTRFLPLTSIVITSCLGNAHPILILISSAVLSPIRRLCFLRINLTMASSKSSPAIFIEVLTTAPPREITAISVVPPPISTIMFPHGFAISMPAPIAAAIGSSIISTDLAPACQVASSTAFFSTSVTPLGTQTAILGFLNVLLPIAFWMKCLIIFSVTV